MKENYVKRIMTPEVRRDLVIVHCARCRKKMELFPEIARKIKKNQTKNIVCSDKCAQAIS